MTRDELRAALALAGAFFMRMTGLFMVLPVLALYVEHLAGATPFLIGLALGLYGLTQASLQIPFGRWSDRAGRKPIIAIGLVIFTLGGLVAASASHIWAVVAGRALQGAGAVSGATLALAADLTRPSQRTKTMAIIGMSIGAAFTVSFLIGPMLDAWFGLRGVFLAAAAFGIAALLVVVFVVPTPRAAQPAPAEPTGAPTPRFTDDVRLLQIGVFCIHVVLAASFVSIPVVLSKELGIASDHHFAVYLPVLLLSLVCAVPAIGLSGRDRHTAALSNGAIACVAAAELLLWIAPAEKYAIGALLTLFFAGVNFLEASLPSRISRSAPRTQTGAALGAYSTGQFLGMFVGGVSGGAVADLFGTRCVFGAAGVLCLGWLAFSLHRHPPAPAISAP